MITRTCRQIPMIVAAAFCIVTHAHIVQAQQPSSGSPHSDIPKGSIREDTIPALLAAPRTGHRAGFSLIPSTPSRAASGRPSSLTPLATGANLPVFGGGTLGRLTKWAGLNSSNSFIGDTSIFEDKNGRVGIGTDTPTSRLTVVGQIETTLGGVKFPDGSVQTTASLPAGQAVRSLNALSGDVTLVSGTNVTITPAGNTLTIAAPNALSAVAHDATLTGNGTGGSPLGLSVPLSFTGSVTGVQGGPGLVNVNNTGSSGIAIEAQGGLSFGIGIEATGFDAVEGIATNIPGSFAGFFDGDVKATGNLTVSGNLNVSGGTKNFKIDHPLDPQNKYLYHAAIESSEVLNFYSGNVTTDEAGDAVVQLPEWFEAINRDFRYQLTVVGSFAQAIVATEVKDNRFTIKTNAARVKVSWQVTAVRSDPVMVKHPFAVEQGKAENERGYYLNPDVYGQPEERGMQWAHNPEQARRIKETREQMRRKGPANDQ